MSWEKWDEEHRGSGRELPKPSGFLKPTFPRSVTSVGVRHTFITNPQGIEHHSDQFLERAEDHELSPAEEEVALALTAGNKERRAVVVNHKGQMAAATSYTEHPTHIKILHLGSLEPGAGTRALVPPLEAAIRSGRGLHLESTPKAIPFYQKLGFINKAGSRDIFETPHSELPGILARVGRHIERYDAMG